MLPPLVTQNSKESLQMMNMMLAVLSLGQRTVCWLENQISTEWIVDRALT